MKLNGMVTILGHSGQKLCGNGSEVERSSMKCTGLDQLGKKPTW